MAQINTAVQDLDQIIQQNASGAEQVAATSEELSGQAEQLQHAITFFKVDSAGARRAAPIVRRQPRKPVAQRRPVAKPGMGNEPSHSPPRPGANGKKPG